MLGAADWDIIVRPEKSPRWLGTDRNGGSGVGAVTHASTWWGDNVVGDGRGAKPCSLCPEEDSWLVIQRLTSLPLPLDGSAGWTGRSR